MLQKYIERSRQDADKERREMRGEEERRRATDRGVILRMGNRNERRTARKDRESYKHKINLKI